MNTEDRITDELVDDWLLFMMRTLNSGCPNQAIAHIRYLSMKALTALRAGALEEALWYREREFYFASRAFGLSNSIAKASLRRLQELKRSLALPVTEVGTRAAVNAA